MEKDTSISFLVITRVQGARAWRWGSFFERAAFSNVVTMTLLDRIRDTISLERYWKSSCLFATILKNDYQLDGACLSLCFYHSPHTSTSSLPRCYLQTTFNVVVIYYIHSSSIFQLHVWYVWYESIICIIGKCALLARFQNVGKDRPFQNFAINIVRWQWLTKNICSICVV